jgi:hypothetical protein
MAQDVELYYWEAASFMDFMARESGQQRFLAFCRELKKTKSFEKALSSTYIRFQNIEDLNKAWVDFLRDKI